MKDLRNSWNQHETGRLGAALAFYTITTLPSFLALLLFLGSYFFDSTMFLRFLENNFSPEIAQFLTEMGTKAFESKIKSGVTLLSIGTLIISSMFLYRNFIKSLYFIWNIQCQKKALWKRFLENILGSLIFIFFIEGVFIFYFAARTLYPFFEENLPLSKHQTSLIFFVLNIFLGFLIPIVFFFFAFHFLSKKNINFKNSILGAFITTSLLFIGNFFLDFYFKNFVDLSAFGTASTIIIILIWIYYMAQIILLGAECTALFSKKNHKKRPLKKGPFS